MGFPSDSRGHWSAPEIPAGPVFFIVHRLPEPDIGTHWLRNYQHISKLHSQEVGKTKGNTIIRILEHEEAEENEEVEDEEEEEERRT